MDTNEIEACNAEYFSSPHERTELSMCVECTKLSYIHQRTGERCQDCDGDLAVEENLPQLCKDCHWTLEGYRLWLQRRQSRDGRDSTEEIELHMDPLSENCHLCSILKREGKSYRNIPTAPETRFRFTDRAINIVGTPYSITYMTSSSRTRSPLVSWLTIRKWIAFGDALSEPTATMLQLLKLLRLDPWLIDVDDRCLVRMSEAEDIIYAALSYVWGGSQPVLLENNKTRMQEAGALDDPGLCSQTIRDAMLACRRTGVRYLWADALCILQDSSPEELSKQTDNMNSIYSNAYFTIVAADSTCAHHGIHGVSIKRGPSENFPFYFRTNDSINVGIAGVTVSSAEALASTTKWATRAWTYQEALLSSRLLIFTEELCFLLSSGGIVGREDRVLEQSTHMSVRIPGNNCLRPLEQDNRELWSLSAFYDMISTFCSRDLTRPDDILRAFSGVITAMNDHLGETRYGTSLRDSNYALSWKHHGLDPFSTASDRERNLNVVRNPSSQREGYPTWSWAGWLHDGAKIHFPARALTTKVAIYYINDTGNLTMTDGLLESNEPGEAKSSETNESLLYPLTAEEKQYIWDTITSFDIPLDSLIILKTLVLRIGIDHRPVETIGDWGLYVHNFEKGKQPAHPKASPLDDPYRSVIHLSREWRESEGDELEFAVLGANTSDSKTLHIETIVLDRSGCLSYRVGATDLRFKVPEESSTEETLARIIKENAMEIVILG